MQNDPRDTPPRAAGGRKTPAAVPSGRAGAGFIPDTSTGLLRDLEKGGAATRWPDFEKRYDPVVRRFLAILARTHPLVDPEDCDDLVQETMVALWRLFPRRVYDRSQGRFRNFLFGVVRRVATKSTSLEWKRRRGEEEAAAAAAAAAAVEPDETLRNEARGLWDAVVGLAFANGRWSDKAKAVFVRTELGEPVGTVAAEYGMTPNSVHQLRYRASRRIEAELRKIVSEASRQSRSGGSRPRRANDRPAAPES